MFLKAFPNVSFLSAIKTVSIGESSQWSSTGIGRGAPGLEQTNDQIAYALTVEGMQVIGRLKATGNPECLVCGYGGTCPMSALPRVLGRTPT